MLYPENFEQKIGFDQIRELIRKHCLSVQACELVDAMSFTTDFDLLVLLLSQVEEMRILLTESEENIPLSSLHDLRPAFARTQADGTFLDEKDVTSLRHNLIILRGVANYLRQRDGERFPRLIALAEPIELFPSIEQRIDSLIDKYGNVKDSASPLLADIRRQIAQAQNSVSRTLHAIMRQAQESGVVEKDASPVLREGRLVIPVSSVNKRKIQGIVHDESATCKPAYIEPAAVVEVNNRLRELQSEERREIIRIFIEFTNEVRPFYPAIEDSLAVVAVIDSVRAKALFAIDINAIRPHLVSDCEIDWHHARHPLLEISLRRQNRAIEPLTIKLNKKQRILLISGPNAGGKSVCLKTVGLLQYMLQCGLLVPLHERSSAGIFKSIFIDIGDEQSIENDLSTYSSHLLNMKNFLKYGNDKTILLIDEFGTGTEPKIGGAIAEALLDRFNAKRMFGVITTHYTNLKHFAAQAEGIVNGAMLYDRNMMRPLFMLSIGTAGSSFAVEIARKIGLPEDIIAAAADMVGVEQVDFDKHLQDVARDKRYWENKRRQIKDKEKRLQQLTEQYEKKLEGMRAAERDTLRSAKEQAKEILQQANSQIEKTIREIKENAAERESTLRSRSEVEQMKQRLSNELKHEKPAVPVKKQPLKVGDNVKIAGQSSVGKLLEVKGKTAIVVFGQLKTTVPFAKLEIATAGEAKQANQAYSSLSKQTSDSIRQKQLNFKQEIDLRGMRVDEALQAVIYFVDDASMLGVGRVRILHGTGTGALRQVIREYLEMSPSVKNYRDEDVRFGGAGITVVELQ